MLLCVWTIRLPVILCRISLSRGWNSLSYADNSTNAIIISVETIIRAPWLEITLVPTSMLSWAQAEYPQRFQWFRFRRMQVPLSQIWDKGNLPREGQTQTFFLTSFWDRREWDMCISFSGFRKSPRCSQHKAFILSLFFLMESTFHGISIAHPPNFLPFLPSEEGWVRVR